MLALPLFARPGPDTGAIHGRGVKGRGNDGPPRDVLCAKRRAVADAQLRGDVPRGQGKREKFEKPQPLPTVEGAALEKTAGEGVEGVAAAPATQAAIPKPVRPCRPAARAGKAPPLAAQ